MDSDTILWDLQNVVPGLASHIRSCCPRDNMRLSRHRSTQMTAARSWSSLHNTTAECTTRETSYPTLQSFSASSLMKHRPSSLQQTAFCSPKPARVSSDDIQAHAALCTAHILVRSRALPDDRTTETDEVSMAVTSWPPSRHGQREDFVTFLSGIAPSPSLKLASLDCTYTVPDTQNFAGLSGGFAAACQGSTRPASGLQQLTRQTEKLLRHRLRKASESRECALSFVGRHEIDETSVGRQAGVGSRAAPAVATGEATLLQCTALLAGVPLQGSESSEKNVRIGRAGVTKDKNAVVESRASRFSDLIGQIERVARPSPRIPWGDTRHTGIQRRTVRVTGDFDDRPVAGFLVSRPTGIRHTMKLEETCVGGPRGWGYSGDGSSAGRRRSVPSRFTRTVRRLLLNSN